MNLTPLRVILGINAVVVLGGLVVAYTPRHDANSAIGGMILPFTVSLIDLVIGLVFLVTMMGMRLTDPEGAAMADKCMQAFMISFAMVLIFAVPACFFGMTRL